MRFVAVTACPTGIAHTLMAAEALKRQAEIMGHEIVVETQGADGTRQALDPGDIGRADAVIIAADIHVDPARFAGKPVSAATTADAIRHPRDVLEAAAAATTEPRHRAARGRAAAGPAADGAPPASLRRAEARRRHDVVPDRHRPHVHGRRGPAQGGRGPRPLDQGRDAGLRRGQERPDRGGHGRGRRGHHRRRHEGRPLALRRQAGARDRDEGRAEERGRGRDDGAGPGDAGAAVRRRRRRRGRERRRGRRPGWWSAVAAAMRACGRCSTST